MKTSIFIFSLLTATALQAQAQSDTTINVYFDSNVFELSAEQQTTLATYKANTVCVISFKGFADTVGTTQNNKLLAQKRVAQVAAVFTDVTNCNTNNQLAAGETVAHGTTLQDNRKVEIRLRLRPATVTVNQEPEIIKTINNFNIRFLPDRAEVDPESTVYLDELYNELITFPSARFEIVGHINLQGKKITNPNDRFFKLSQARAKLIADYLILKGIAQDRMQHRGVANSQPLHATPANEQQKRENMRVEIKVMK